MTENGLGQDLVTQRLWSAGVPTRFLSGRLAGFEPRRGTRAALAAAVALSADPARSGGLILSGPPGTGKTHLAVGILAARLDAWLTANPLAHWQEDDGQGGIRIVVRVPLEVRFVVVPSFLDRLRSAIRWAEAEDPLPELFAVNLLVLDDLGREKVTDWATERLYVLVNERYNRELPTIVTTNYGPQELADRGYDALVSRLVEGSGMVQLTASDYRIGAR